MASERRTIHALMRVCRGGHPPLATLPGDAVENSPLEEKCTWRGSWVRVTRLVQLVIGNATIVTMNGSRDVLRDAELVIEGDRIVKVGPRSKGPSARAHRFLDARGKVVLPGLIHSHLHACQTLCRGHADGLELLEWLRERIWPFEAAHDRESMRASADSHLSRVSPKRRDGRARHGQRAPLRAGIRVGA